MNLHRELYTKEKKTAKNQLNLKCTFFNVFFLSEKCMLLFTTVRRKSDLFLSRQLLTLSVITGN